MKQSKVLKLKENKKKEQHELEIKSHSPTAHTTHSHSSHKPNQAPTGVKSLKPVKKSKPMTAKTPFQYFKEANSSKSAGYCLEKWREMTDVDKIQFNELAQKDKERYISQMAEWEKIKAQTEHQKVQKKDLRKASPSDEEKKNQGPKKLTKKEKLVKEKEKKEMVKQERINKWAKKKKEEGKEQGEDEDEEENSDSEQDEEESSENHEEEDENDSDDDDEDEDEDDDEDDDDDDEDEDEEEDDEEEDDDDDEEEEKELYDDDGFVDEDGGDGWSDMKRGFKSSHHNSQRGGRKYKWNK